MWPELASLPLSSLTRRLWPPLQPTETCDPFQSLAFVARVVELPAVLFEFHLETVGRDAMIPKAFQIAAVDKRQWGQKNCPFALVHHCLQLGCHSLVVADLHSSCRTGHTGLVALGLAHPSGCVYRPNDARTS